MNIQSHIEEVTGAAFGTSGGLVVIATSPQAEFIGAVITAFVCGVAGAIGGYLVKLVAKRFSKTKKD